MVDDRKKMAGCVVREEARHPVIGEIVKQFKDPLTGELVGVIFAYAGFEFTLHDNAVKIKTVFTSRINEKSVAWQRWRDLAKH